jgi:hypothetical protein
MIIKFSQRIECPITSASRLACMDTGGLAKKSAAVATPISTMSQGVMAELIGRHEILVQSERSKMLRKY